MDTVLPLLLGYGVGSLPIGYLIASTRSGIDLRRVGSGNVGAANVYRTAGLWTALLVIRRRRRERRGQRAPGGSAERRPAARRSRPAWRRSSATCIRSGCASAAARASPPPAACSRCSRRSRRRSPPAMFVVTVWVTRYVSLGSIVATIALPTLAWLTRASMPVVTGGVVAALLIIERHRGNLSRLRTGPSAGWGSGYEDDRRSIRPARAGRRPPPQAVAVRRRRAAGARRSPMHLARVGHEVRLWGRDAALVADMTSRRANAIYLPDVTLSRVAAADALARRRTRRRRRRRASRFRRTACGACSHDAAPHAVAGRAGRERRQGTRRASHAAHVRSDRRGAPAHARAVVLSGPSFAAELARELPTAVVVASPSADGGRAGAARVPIGRAPPVRQRRCRRRRNRRRAEEHHRDRRGRRRRSGPGPQRARRARSRAGWPRSRGSPWRSARSARRWPDSPGSAISC